MSCLKFPVTNQLLNVLAAKMVLPDTKKDGFVKTGGKAQGRITIGTKYSSLICRRLELEGKIEASLMRYMDGLALMDSEPELQMKILELAQHLNYTNSIPDITKHLTRT